MKVHHRHRQPCPEHTRSHRRRALVHHLNEGCTLLACRRSEDLEVTECETVHPHERILVDTGNRADVAEFLMLGLLQIDQKGAGRSHCQRECIHCKSLQRIHLKLPLELLYRIVVYKGPFIESGNVVMVSVSLLCAFFISPRHQKLLRSE